MKEERIIVILEIDVYKVRRLGREMALKLGFDRIAAGEIEVAISELAGNIIKHKAVPGQITLKPLSKGGGTGLEIRAEDKGPGIREPFEAMEGGKSTAGSLGIGLSGVKRLMDEFSLNSEPLKGTTVVARKWLNKEIPQRMNFSVMARPKPGEEVSGDAWFIRPTPDYVFFSLIDAIGHGQEAHQIAGLVLEILEDLHPEPMLYIIDRCHAELKYTIGVAMAMVRVKFEEGKFEHISIGNVETRVYGTTEAVRPFCFNGTLGMAMERHYVSEYPYQPGATFIMFSDGISGRVELIEGIFTRSVQELANFIFYNYNRNYDDATVLVAR